MEELLQLQITFLNSTFEKGSQASNLLSWSLSSRLKSTHLSWALLKVEWSVFQRLSISRHGWLLNLIALTARSLYLLIQFIRSHGPTFLLAISWIFWLKKLHLVFLIVFLNAFQSLIFLYFCIFQGCCYNLHPTKFWNVWWYWYGNSKDCWQIRLLFEWHFPESFHYVYLKYQ